MNKEHKFYDFKNMNEQSSDLYVYGEIIDGEKWDETDVNLSDFQNSLNALFNNSTLNMYINSPGGSVFASSTMCSMLKRAKENKNITINAFIDGLAASAASYLPMIADNIYMYNNSMLMIHKPMSVAWGNANDLQKEIDVLNKLEDNVMIPLYMNKCKKDEEELKTLINNETWLDSKESNELFNITLIDEDKEAVACVDEELFKNYKNVPKKFKDIAKENEKENKAENLEKEKIQNEIKQDYSYYDEIISSFIDN